MDGLACVLGDLRQEDAAEKLHRQVVEKALNVLGSSHVQTLCFRSNLACFLHAKGDLIEARQLHMDVFEHRKRTLGSKHPDTLRSANNLACLLQDQQLGLKS